MDFLKSQYNIISIILFVLCIVIAHLVATNNYDFSKNTISDLGAQGYDRKLIVQTGFLLFGLTITAGVIANGLSLRTSPILIYGFCVALTGVFCTKPFFDISHINYSETQSNLHSLFAQIAGLSFSIGILAQLFNETDRTGKIIHLVFFVLIIGLSATFKLLENYQGIAQRFLYLISFLWFINFYKP